VAVAYNAESTLRATLDRVPGGFRERIAEVIVLDDASGDETFAQGQAWAEQPGEGGAHVVVIEPGPGTGLLSVAPYERAL